MKTDQNGLPLGLVLNMPAEQYHADPGVSNSMLSSMAKSPAHCYALHLDPARPAREATGAMNAGTLAHCAILEPAELEKRYVVKPDGLRLSTKDGIAWRDAQTRTIIGRAEYEAALGQREAVLRVPALRRILSAGIAEASIFWIDKATGLRCKCRVDWLHQVSARKVEPLDLKTIADITPDSVERNVTVYGYHRQRAHYMNGIRAVGLAADDFAFAFVSGSYPFIATGYLLDAETCEQGEDEVAELLERFADCQARGEWPAFGDGFQLTGLKRWARRSQEVEVAFVD